MHNFFNRINFDLIVLDLFLIFYSYNVNFFYKNNLNLIDLDLFLLFNSNNNNNGLNKNNFDFVRLNKKYID